MDLCKLLTDLREKWDQESFKVAIGYKKWPKAFEEPVLIQLEETGGEMLCPFFGKRNATTVEKTYKIKILLDRAFFDDPVAELNRYFDEFIAFIDRMGYKTFCLVNYSRDDDIEHSVIFNARGEVYYA